MPRRKPLPTDTRPSWTDEDLYVLRKYKMANGDTMTEVDPDYERRYRGHMMEVGGQPSFRDDPTYNLRRRKRGKDT